MGGISMTGQNEFDKTSDPRKKDLKFVLIMLAIYTVCCVVFVSGSFLWIREDRNTRQEHAVATQGAISTQQAFVTSTAMAHSTEQAQYEFIDRFDDNSGRWYQGKATGDYGDYSAYITDGVYVWSISDTGGYIQGDDYYKGNNFKNFDLYVDIKFDEDTEAGTACSGLVFRKSTLGWEDGAYIFSICNDSHYEVYYYQIGDWDSLTTSWARNTIVSGDWNRIEVHAMDDQFTFYINNSMVFEMTDSRRKTGRFGIYIEADEGSPALTWFDNFSYQRR